jgi:adenosine deaminase
VRDELGLTTAQLETLALNSFDASFAPPELREAWKDEVHAWSTQQVTAGPRDVLDDG